MVEASVIAPIVVAVILLLLFLFLRSTIYIVSQAEGPCVRCACHPFVSAVPFIALPTELSFRRCHCGAE